MVSLALVVRRPTAAIVAAVVFCAASATLPGCDDGPGAATDQTKPDGAGAAGSSGGTSKTVKKPSFVLSRDPGGCPTVGGPNVVSSTSYVVQWTLVDECTGLGGQYIVAKDLDGTRQFYLGGHGCYALPSEYPTYPSPPLRYGVLRGSQTAALFEAGPCVALPGDPPDPSPNPTTVEAISTDLIAETLEAYETLEDARAAR